MTDLAAGRRRPRAPPSGLSTAAERRLRMRLRLARAALLWERTWPALWPGVAVVALFAILALFDFLPLLPGAGHALALGALGVGLLAAAIHAVRAIRVPVAKDAARRRIERASGLAHRPLQALADQPSVPLDPAAARLWDAHRQHMLRAVRRLRVGWPAAGLAHADPWGLRAVLAMLLVIGAVDAGGDWRLRVVRALSPDIGGGAFAAAPSLDIWVTPPEYTELAPQFLRPGSAGRLRIPTGSTLLAQVHGGSGVPRLGIGGQAQKFAAVDKANFRATARLTTGNSLVVRQDGEVLGRWPIEIVPDLPPTIAFAASPGATPHAMLHLTYKATDDYGVEGVTALVRRPGAKPGAGGPATVTLALPLPGVHLKTATATSYTDLTANPWAGLPVEIRLVAKDALGQTGTTAWRTMTLPERVFHNPVARAIIEERKALVADPKSRRDVAEILGDLNGRPELYGNDDVVFLGLRLSQRTLGSPDGARATTQAGIERLLWNLALRIDGGDLPFAESALRELERRLQDALAHNAPDAQVNRLVQELHQALDRYMQALAKSLQGHPEQALKSPGRMPSLTGQDLQHMLDRARELARNGDRAQARQMLSQLQNMLENLRSGTPSQSAAQKEGEQMMQDLRTLMQRQQQLLDKSFQTERQQDENGIAPQGSPPGGKPGSKPGDDAAAQQALRFGLGAIMRRLGEALPEIPAPFGRAERAMKDATRALRGNDPGAAIDPQSEALAALQEATRNLARRMQQQGGGALSLGLGSQMPGEANGRDPLGRPLTNGGRNGEGEVKIPDHETLQRSREILDLLRRRAGERSRPAVELDYLDRLLKRF